MRRGLQTVRAHPGRGSWRQNSGSRELLWREEDWFMLRMIGSEMTSTWAEAREIRGKEQRAEGGWLVQVNVGNISGDRARGDGPTPITNTTSHDVTCCELGWFKGRGT